MNEEKNPKNKQKWWKWSNKIQINGEIDIVSGLKETTALKNQDVKLSCICKDSTQFQSKSEQNSKVFIYLFIFWKGMDGFYYPISTI